MTEDKIPDSYCERGHRLVWDEDGQGFAIYRQGEDRWTNRVRLEGNAREKVKFCVLCGAHVGAKQ